MLVFDSLEMYTANQVFLKMFENDTNNSEEMKKWQEYEVLINEIKKGIYETLIITGFWTREEVSEFRRTFHDRTK